MSLMSLGLTRGIVGMVAGLISGFVLIMLGRIVGGYETVWAGEAAWALGSFLGTVGFMIGVGALTDWYRWTRGENVPMRHGPPEDKPAWTRYFSVDYNHKVIGIQYGVTSGLLLFVGGTIALIFRTELARAGLQFLDPNLYNTFIGMHGWVALASVLLGVGAMANYLVPLLLGAEDMAFPRLNAFAFWINVPAGLPAADQHVPGLGFGVDGLPAAEPARPGWLPALSDGDLLCGPLFDFGLAQPDRHDAADAARRHGALPDAHLLLGHSGDQPPAGNGHAANWPLVPDALLRAYHEHGFL